MLLVGGIILVATSVLIQALDITELLPLLRVPVQIKDVEGEVDEVSDFIFNLGDDLPNLVNSFCRENRLSIGSCSSLKFHTFEQLWHMVIDTNTGIRYGNSDDSKFFVYWITPTENMDKFFRRVCEDFNMDFLSEQCHSELERVIDLTWSSYLDSHVRRKYADSRLKQIALDIANNESISFHISSSSQYFPVGIGNVLKGLISMLSVHENTKVVQRSDSVLGGYNAILDASQVTLSGNNSSETASLGRLIEEIFSWRWLVLYDEEYLFTSTSDGGYNNKSPTAPDAIVYTASASLSPLFSVRYAIDQLFDRYLLPTPVVKRILKGVRRLKFLPQITDRANEIADSLIHPSLGVTVRSWNGTHDIKIYGRRVYDPQAYMTYISDIVHRHEVKSVLLAYDNPAYVRPSFTAFLSQLREETGVQIVETWKLLEAGSVAEEDGFQPQDAEKDLDDDRNLSSSSVNLLEKAAIEMLALSKTNIMLGDPQSTFLEVAYFLGECRQLVYHPYIYSLDP